MSVSQIDFFKDFEGQGIILTAFIKLLSRQKNCYGRLFLLEPPQPYLHSSFSLCDEEEEEEKGEEETFFSSFLLPRE